MDENPDGRTPRCPRCGGFRVGVVRDRLTCEDCGRTWQATAPLSGRAQPGLRPRRQLRVQPDP